MQFMATFEDITKIYFRKLTHSLSFLLVDFAALCGHLSNS